jgi:acetyltransferase-like isoleucine patch superfamily enzyme
LGKSDLQIHSSAIIERSVELGKNNIVEPNAVIIKSVRTGTRCFIGTSSRLQGPIKLGNSVFIGEFVSIGFPIQAQIIAYQTGKIESPLVASKPIAIGNHCIIRTGTVIYTNVRLGNHVRTGHNAIIREGVTIGDHTLVGSGTIIDGNTSIGNSVSIQSNVYIPWNSTIEDHVFLGPNCILTNDKYVMRAPYDLKGPIIRRGVSVGAGAIIMPSIEIGEEAVIGAGAVVTRNVPPKTIVFGVPAEIKSKIPKDWDIPMK